MKCEIKEGKLYIFDDTGKVAWKGLVEGFEVLRAYPVPDTEDFIVLLDSYGGPGWFQNLLRMSSDGTIIWKAELLKMSGRREYSGLKEVESTHSVVEAFEPNGYWVKINLETGKIISTVYTK